MPTIGELLLFAVTLFPVWGWILVILAHRKLEENTARVIAVGTLGFWILNLAVFDVAAGFLLYVVNPVRDTTLLQHWQWFWPWGSWLILALTIGNLVNIGAHGIDPEPTDTIEGFLIASYVVATVSFLVVVGATVAAAIAGALGYFPQ